MLKVLTVGDGDLTLSLALARAYGGTIDLTASVLDSKESLVDAFPDAPLEELDSRSVDVLYELDATQLHQQFPSSSWDLVLFHHPHLGLASLDQDEAGHARAHYSLLCHYLHSASQVSKLVHVCLCGTQPETWKLAEATERHGLSLIKKISTAVPFSRVWSDDPLDAAPAAAEHAAPRRYRNGKLGSRHFLGKYGYRHRRTAGERFSGMSSDMNVAGSMHFVCQLLDRSARDNLKTEAGPQHSCAICGTEFSSEADLTSHLLSPAQPQKAGIANSVCTSHKTGSTSEQPKTPESGVAVKPPAKRSRPDDSASSNDSNADDKLQEVVVSSASDGKRLRWFLQHEVGSFSKRQAEASIREGRILVNGSAAMDSSRILATGTVVAILSPTSSVADKGATIEVVDRQATVPLLVVRKPAGMRTKGFFSGTLEYAVSQQEGIPYTSLSKLDTSCPGLCVMTNQPTDTSVGSVSIPAVQHCVIAMVHGRVPDTWFPHRQTSMMVKPKWKGKSRDNGAVISEQVALKVAPLERTNESNPELLLTTISIQTENPSAASLCQWLRQEGYPVVGDMYCRQEYLKLKRSIRNRIKDKVCLGCYQVEWDGLQVPKVMDIPKKLSASYWESAFVEDSKGVDKST